MKYSSVKVVKSISANKSDNTLSDLTTLHGRAAKVVKSINANNSDNTLSDLTTLPDILDFLIGPCSFPGTADTQIILPLAFAFSISEAAGNSSYHFKL